MPKAAPALNEVIPIECRKLDGKLSWVEDIIPFLRSFLTAMEVVDTEGPGFELALTVGA